MSRERAKSFATCRLCSENICKRHHELMNKFCCLFAEKNQQNVIISIFTVQN